MSVLSDVSLEPQTAVGLGEGSSARSGELLGCGPQVGSCSWDPAGESCDGGAPAEERSVLPVPSLCLLSSLHPQLCLWPCAAQPFVPLP